METMKMMQGDTHLVPFTISLDDTGEKITPEMADDIEVCIGKECCAMIRKVYSEGSVAYDAETEQWFFRPSQQETLDLEPDSQDVIARVRIGDDVRGVKIGRLLILSAQSKEVI